MALFEINSIILITVLMIISNQINGSDSLHERKAKFTSEIYQLIHREFCKNICNTSYGKSRTSRTIVLCFIKCGRPQTSSSKPPMSHSSTTVTMATGNPQMSTSSKKPKAPPSAKPDATPTSKPDVASPAEPPVTSSVEPESASSKKPELNPTGKPEPIISQFPALETTTIDISVIPINMSSHSPPTFRLGDRRFKLPANAPVKIQSAPFSTSESSIEDRVRNYLQRNPMSVSP